MKCYDEKVLKRLHLIALTLVLAACAPPPKSVRRSFVPAEPNAAEAPVLGNVRFVPQAGHGTPALAVAIAANGRYAVSGGEDGMLAHWDLATKRLVRTLFVPATIRSAALSSDGRTALVAGVDEVTVYRELKLGGKLDDEHAKNHFAIGVWDLVEGRRSRRLEGHTTVVRGLALFGDGKYALSCAEGGEVMTWDIAKAKMLSSFTTHGILTTCALSPDATTLATAGEDRKVHLWDVARRTELRAFAGHSDSIESIAFSSDGKLLVSASRDRSARVWNVSGVLPPRVFGHHEGAVAFAAVRNSGALVTGGPAEGGIKVWDASGRLLRTVSSRGITLGALTPEAGIALTSNADASVNLFDLTTGTLTRKFAGRSLRVDALGFSADGAHLVSGGVKGATLWNTPTLYRARHFADEPGSLGRHLGISESGRLIGARTADNHVRTMSAESGRPKSDLGVWAGSASPFDQGKALVGRGSQISLVDLDTERAVVTIPARPEDIAGWTLSSDGTTLVTLDGAGTLRLWKTADGSLQRAMTRSSPLPVPAGAVVVLRLEGSRIFVFVGDLLSSSLNVWDLQSGRTREIAATSRDVTSARFLSDGRALLIGTVDGDVHVWDTELGVLLRKIEGHGGAVTSIAAPPRGRLYASGTADGTVRLANIDTGASATLLDAGGEWLIYTNDGYFDASRSGADLVAMVKGLEVFAVDQFAIKNNRPDVILRRFGLGTPAVLAHYESRFERRLRRAGLTAERLRSDLHVPEATIVRVKTEGKVVDLQLKLKDTTFPLKHYNVYVNDVPLFGASGKEIGGKDRALTERIELTEGTNRIEVSCTNGVGVESYRAQTVVEYTNKTRGSLFYVGFGVSKYKDERLDLEFAHKDAHDLGRVLGSAKREFDRVEVKTFQNEEVGPEAFVRAKAFLESAGVDDTVVVFIAGHGVHAGDREGTYYYVVHATEVNRLAETAVNFDVVEGLVQGIRARRRLVLLDTCESGELDDERDARSALPTGGARGLRSRAIRGLRVDPGGGTAHGAKTGPAPTTAPNLRRSYLSQRDRYVYSDVSRRSGAIVLASAQGTESSYESQDTQNGFFTYELIASLSASSADVDRDGWLNTRELRDSVTRAVSQRSAGRQNPTIDRDNIQQRIALPLVPRTR